MIALLVIVALARPASAQTKPASRKPASSMSGGMTSDVAGSYSIVHISEEGASSTSPVGWVFAWSGKINDMFAVVADVAGHYKWGGDFEGAGLKVHTFQGGGKYLFPTSGKAKPYAGAVLGLAHVSATGGFSENDFVITPMVGVDVPANDKWTFRIELGIPFIKSDSNTDKGPRISFGVVKQLRK